MKQILIIFLFAWILNFPAFGQESDSILTKTSFGGYSFSQGDKQLKVREMVAMMEDNPTALPYMKSASSSHAFASVLGLAGGFMIGWPIGSAIAGGDPNWALAGIGAGLIVVSIPVIRSFNRKATKAVDIYNGDLQTQNRQTSLHFIINNHGTGLALRF